MTALKSIWRIALMLVAVTACAHHRPSVAAHCDVTDMRALFAAPLGYDGQRFCGRGYLTKAQGVLGIYPDPIMAESAPYEMAILLNASSGEGLPSELSAGSTIPIFLSGRLDTAACNSVLDEESSCVPVRRAIFLDHWSVDAIP